MITRKLKVAVQKAGRLSEGSINLLRTCGIRFDNGLAKLKSSAKNFPLEIFFLRDDDIPQYVEDAVADIGIVGENVTREKRCAVETLAKLDFGHCRLALAVPKSFPYDSIASLGGKRIATSYPKILGEFLADNQTNAEIHSISGSVEIAPSIGLADAVCDLVSSGSTLFTNGLREVATVIESQAVLIGRQNLEPETSALLEKLLFRIKAARAAAQNKYILLNAPDEKLAEITALLPGIKSPTVLPLALSGWSSIHSVVGENDLWDTVERLKESGAQGILVVSIDQMIR